MNDDEYSEDIFYNMRRPEDIAVYIQDALKCGDAAIAAAAIGNVTRFIGMAKIAERTGLQRERLYRVFSDKGDPRLGTLMIVLTSLGLKLSVEVLEDKDQNL